MNKKLSTAVSKLVGKECWACIAGEGTGSMVNLHIGARVKRERPIHNPYLSKEERENRGEFGLFIKDATWRLHNDKGVVCGCNDSNDNDGDMVRGLNKLKGTTITGVKMCHVTYDLDIKFSNGFTLRILCDQTNPKLKTDNYSLRTHKEYLIISSRSHIRQEVLTC